MTSKWEFSEYKNPLARARGTGSIKHGFQHWWLQRLTAVSNFLLVIWAIFAVVGLIGTSYEDFTFWLAQPLNAILLSLFILSSFIHAALGLQVVIEDYVHTEITKVVSLMAVRLILTGLAVAALFSILKIAL